MKLTREQTDKIYDYIMYGEDAMNKDEFNKGANKIHQLIYDQLPSAHHMWEGTKHYFTDESQQTSYEQGHNELMKQIKPEA